MRRIYCCRFFSITHSTFQQKQPCTIQRLNVYVRYFKFSHSPLIWMFVGLGLQIFILKIRQCTCQGCTIAIEFAKITEHFLNLLNSIVIEPRSLSKCKKSEGRYCNWYWTSRCMIIEFICVIEILSLCILLLKLRLNCRFSSSTIATEIEKRLCTHCYWSWDWIATFSHPQLQPKLKSYSV